METLAVVEVLGRRGEVVAREKIHSLPATIGRGFDSDVILDDEFVAPHHLQLEAADDGGFRVSDLGTVNGFSVLGGPLRKSDAAASVLPGQTIRLGHSQIRVWRPDSRMAPELPALRTAARSWIEFFVWVSAGLGAVALYSWVGATGSGRGGTIIFAAMSATVVMLGWSGLWWISSRNAHKGDTFLAHAAIAGGMVCLVALSDFMDNSLAFVFDLHSSTGGNSGGLMVVAAISFSVYRHLRLVSRKRKWVLGVLACLFVVALMFLIGYASNEQSREKLGEMEIPSSLRLPWMRVVDGVSPEKFFE